jgi:hypothetical protein
MSDGQGTPGSSPISADEVTTFLDRNVRRIHASWNNYTRSFLRLSSPKLGLEFSSATRQG